MSQAWAFLETAGPSPSFPQKVPLSSSEQRAGRCVQLHSLPILIQIRENEQLKSNALFNKYYVGTAFRELFQKHINRLGLLANSS